MYWRRLSICTAHYTGETLVYVTLLSADVLETAFYMHSSLYWGNISLCDFTVCRCTEDGFLYGTAHYTGETLVYVTLLSADVLRTPFYMAQLIILGKH